MNKVKNRVVFFVSSLLKKRIVRVALPLLLLVVGAIFALVYLKIIKNPINNLSLLQKGPRVAIKTEYKNPFDKKTQYVNPFETYKNPFVIAK